MYTPPHFEASPDVVAELLANHGAADLITVTDEGLAVTTLPFVFDPDDGPNGSLLGHVARANDHWRQAVRGDALVIVRGPDGYVSPSWYPSKAEDHRVVPTWNYLTAHVYGQAEWHDDPTWAGKIVRRLTDKHEASLGSSEPWKVDDAPAEFIETQLRAVVGLRIEITRIEAKAKLSQNRSVDDRGGVVEALATFDPALAAAVVESNS